MKDSIDLAADFIKMGKLVAFPTETVYGLGADATNEMAVKEIYALKGRPSINPLIVHVRSLDEALKIAVLNEKALKVARYFWPGPLTIVARLGDSTNIAASVLAGLETVAIRVPAHRVALELLQKSGVPIAAPSANPSGYISATRHEHVLEHFAGKDALVLRDKEECKYGIESTILDTTSKSPTVLRSGFITLKALAEVLEEEVLLSSSLMQIKAPGMLDKHYAPATKLRLNSTDLAIGEVGLNFGGARLLGAGSLNLSDKSDLIEAAANLYDMLKRLDDYARENNLLGIAVAPIPNEGVGLAINDRLQRAAF